MKNLLFAFLCVVVIAACSDNPTNPEPEFEPYTVGSFLMTSPQSAEWIGNQSSKLKSAQSDTIEIEQPGDHSLEIWRDQNATGSSFSMRFIDSTITVVDARQHNIQLPVMKNPKAGQDYPLGASSGGNDFNDDRMESIFDMQFTCNTNFNKQAPIIQLVYKKEDGTIFRVYNIHVNGILDAVNEIMPC